MKMKCFSSLSHPFSHSDSIFRNFYSFCIVLIVTLSQIIMLTRVMIEVGGELTNFSMPSYSADDKSSEETSDALILRLEQAFLAALKHTSNAIQTTEPHDEPEVYFTLEDKLLDDLQSCPRYSTDSHGLPQFDKDKTPTSFMHFYIDKVNFNPLNPDVVIIGVKTQTIKKHEKSLHAKKDDDNGTPHMGGVARRMGHLKMLLSNQILNPIYKDLSERLFAATGFPKEDRIKLQEVWERFTVIMYNEALYIRYRLNVKSKETLFLVFDPLKALRTLLAGQLEYSDGGPVEAKRSSVGAEKKVKHEFTTEDKVLSNVLLMRTPVSFSYKCGNKNYEINCFWCPYSSYMQFNGANLLNYVYYFKPALDINIIKSPLSRRLSIKKATLGKHINIIKPVIDEKEVTPAGIPNPFPKAYKDFTPDQIRMKEFLTYASLSSSNGKMHLYIPPINRDRFIEIKVKPEGYFISTTALFMTPKKDRGFFIIVENPTLCKGIMNSYSLLDFELNIEGDTAAIPPTFTKSRVISFEPGGKMALKAKDGVGGGVVLGLKFGDEHFYQMDYSGTAMLHRHEPRRAKSDAALPDTRPSLSSLSRKSVGYTRSTGAEATEEAALEPDETKLLLPPAARRTPPLPEKPRHKQTAGKSDKVKQQQHGNVLDKFGIDRSIPVILPKAISARRVSES